MRRPNPVATYRGGPVPYSEALGDYTPEHVEEGRRLLAIHATGQGGFARYGRVPHESPKGKGVTGSGACHANMRYKAIGEGATRLLVTSSCPSIRRASSEASRAWFDWLIHRSPWSDVVIEEVRDTDFCLEQGIIMDAAYPSCFIQGMCISMRHPGESPDVVNRWFDLVTKHGIPENLALVMAYFNSTPTFGVSLPGPRGAHQPIDGQINIGNFLKADIQALASELPWWEHSPYVGVCGLWGPSDVGGRVPEYSATPAEYGTTLGALVWEYAKANPPSSSAQATADRLKDPFARAATVAFGVDAMPYLRENGWNTASDEFLVKTLLNFFKEKGVYVQQEEHAEHPGIQAACG